MNHTTNSTDSSILSVLVHDIPLKPLITKNNDTLKSNSFTGNQWFRNGIKIDGADQSIYKPKNSGNYSVRVTLNGCESEMSEIVIIETGVFEEIFYGLEISPNPAYDFIEINDEAEHTMTNQEIGIYDVFGRCVVKTSPPAPLHVERGVRIDVSGLAAGMYFVRIGAEVHKFVKL